MNEHEEYTLTTAEVREAYAEYVDSADFPTERAFEEHLASGGGGGEFDRWLAAHDRALRKQIEQQMIERAYFHIAWEKGLTNGRAKVPPHWVEAATARLAPYLDIIRGEGSE